MSLAIESIIDIMDYEGEEELALIISEFILSEAYLQFYKITK